MALSYAVLSDIVVGGMSRPRKILLALADAGQVSEVVSLVCRRAECARLAMSCDVLEAGCFDPSRGYPAVVPYVRYADPTAAIAWLTEVLDAAELLRMPLPDGRVAHAELSVGDSVISLGLASTSRVVDRPTRSTLAAMTLVFVDDVDVRAEQAVAAGGDLIDPPTTQPWGIRQAIVADPEGHLWELSTHLCEVSPQSWGAEVSGP